MKEATYTASEWRSRIASFGRLVDIRNFPDLAGSGCWRDDQACLSAEHLTTIGQRLFGDRWDRITGDKRASRTECLCSAYWDLSNIKGHKKCGSQATGCLYCSASSQTFGKSTSTQTTMSESA